MVPNAAPSARSNAGSASCASRRWSRSRRWSWRWAGGARVGGLLSREEFYRRYEEASGLKVEPEAVRFWEVLGNLKLAAIFLTGARSFCEGRSKDAVHAFTAHLNPEIEAEILRLIA